jgi:hypothetical protein
MDLSKMKRSENITDAGFTPGGNPDADLFTVPVDPNGGSVLDQMQRGGMLIKDDLVGMADSFLGNDEEMDKVRKEMGLDFDPAEVVGRIDADIAARRANETEEQRKKREEMLKKIDPQGTIQKFGELGEDPDLEDAINATRDAFDLGVEGDADSTVRTVLPDNPDEVARNRKLSEQTDLPVETVADDPAAAELIVREKDINGALAVAPATRDLFADPEFAAISHDLAESLADIEVEYKADIAPEEGPGFFEGLAKTQLPMYQKAVAGVLGMYAENSFVFAPDMGGGTIDPRTDPQMLEALGDTSNDPLMGAATELALDAQAAIIAARPDMEEGSAQEFAFDVTNSFLQMIPTLTAAVVTRNANVGLVVMGGQVYGGTYADSRFIKGLSDEQAKADAAFYALAETMTEKVPLEALFKGGKFVGAKFLKVVAGEAAGESVTAALENGYEIFQGRKDMTAPEFFTEMAKAGLAGATLGGLMYGSTAPFTGERRVKDDVGAKESKTYSDALTKAAEASQGSPLAARDPAAAAEHLGAVIKSGGNEEVIVSVEGLDAILTPEKVNLLFQENGWTQDAINQERALGGSLTLTPEQYAKMLGTDPEVAELNRHVRAHHDAPTVAEAEAAKELEKVETEVKDEPAEEPAVEGEAKEEGLKDGTLSEMLETEAEAKEGAEAKKTRPISASKWVPAAPYHKNEALDLAEEQLGLQSMLQHLEQAGMSKQERELYLQMRVKAAKAAEVRKHEIEIRRKEQELTQEWNDKKADVRARMAEHVSQKPIYQAIDNITQVRLDRDAVAKIIGEKEMENLPTQAKGRKIWAAKSEEITRDPAEWADLHGYESAEHMLQEMLKVPPKEDAIDIGTDLVMAREHGDLDHATREIREALEALHNDGMAELLAYELHWLRKAKEMGRISPQAIRAEGKRRIMDTPRKRATPARFFADAARAGKKAGMLLRKGDRNGAAHAKAQQVINFTMAREMIALKEKQVRYGKKLNKWSNPSKTTKLPPLMQEGLAKLFSNIRVGSDVSPAPVQDMAAYERELQAKYGVAIELPSSIKNQSTIKFVDDLTVGEYEDLYMAARKIYGAGLNENKMFRAAQKKTRQQLADEVAASIETNIKPDDKELQLARREHTAGRDIGQTMTTILVNEDTVFAKMDGKLFGTVYQIVKGGIDRAVSHGYQKGQKGLNRRRKEVMTAYNSLITSRYTRKERHDMAYKRDINIPGMPLMSRETAISIVLNTGNHSSSKAMEEAGYTPEMVQRVRDALDKKDLDFAQDVWDMMDSFWPEIKATQERRHDPLGNKVQAVGFQTKHGHYRGGYYPLEYAGDKSVSEYDQATASIAQLVQQSKIPGSFTKQYTERGHTEQRKGSGGKKPRLNLSVAQRHLDQVIYDLEMGDAIADAYRVWNHPTVQTKFQDKGHWWMHQHIDLFLENMITGELHMPDKWSRLARFTKAGLTVGSLGYNAVNAVMQVGGVFNTAAQVGPVNAARGLLAFSTTNPVKLVKWIREDPVMQQRALNYNEAMTDAVRLFSSNKRWNRLTQADKIVRIGFYGMHAVQYVTDTLAYMMAYTQGKKMFPGDDAAARFYAGKIVKRTQGSGDFNERTTMERGTISHETQNSDIIRAMNPLVSYFAAKYSIMVQKTQAAKAQPSVGTIADAFQAYLVAIVLEAIAAVLLKQMLNNLWDNLWGGSDEEPEEMDEEQLAKAQAAAMKEYGKAMVGNAVGGIPFARDIWAATQGYGVGGALGSATMDVGRFLIQAGQMEFDKSLWNSAANLFGYVGIPKQVTRKYVPDWYRKARGAVEEEDQNFFDKLMDVKGEQ